ncbi:MAG: hypothetical protein KA715_03145 [Xanthomonadaceae bacterium]|nr:hypothetical protein [Xanthomonadaceae bacterium]
MKKMTTELYLTLFILSALFTSSTHALGATKLDYELRVHWSNGDSSEIYNANKRPSFTQYYRNEISAVLNHLDSVTQEAESRIEPGTKSKLEGKLVVDLVLYWKGILSMLDGGDLLNAAVHVEIIDTATDQVMGISSSQNLGILYGHPDNRFETRMKSSFIPPLFVEAAADAATVNKGPSLRAQRWSILSALKDESVVAFFRNFRGTLEPDTYNCPKEFDFFRSQYSELKDTYVIFNGRKFELAGGEDRNNGPDSESVKISHFTKKPEGIKMRSDSYVLSGSGNYNYKGYDLYAKKNKVSRDETLRVVYVNPFRVRVSYEAKTRKESWSKDYPDSNYKDSWGESYASCIYNFK